jgi:hypothetical protein
MQKTHGEIQRVDGKRVASPEYRAWQALRDRCLNVNSKNYPYYGGRGIGICARWEKFENFLEDMGRRPGDDYTLERKNSDRNYTPSNCCWATRETQARNRAYAKTKAWVLAEQLGLTINTVRHYLWTIRAELRGEQTRYVVPAEARKQIIKHMGNNL